MTQPYIKDKKVYFDMYTFNIGNYGGIYPVGSFSIDLKELTDIEQNTIYAYILKNKECFFTETDKRILKIMNGNVFGTVTKGILDITHDQTHIGYVINNIRIF